MAHMTHSSDPAPAPPRMANSALTTLVNYLIISALLACAAFGVVQLGQLVLPAWNTAYVPVVCFLVALESAYMTRYIRYGRLPAPWYVLRAIEAVVLYLMLRALVGLLRGPFYVPDQTANRIDVDVLALTISALVTWLTSWRLTANLLDLDMLDPNLDREVIHIVAQEQVEDRRSLMSFVIIIGVALTFLAGLLRIHLRTSAQVQPPALYGFGHVLIYFFLALVLSSRTRLHQLQSGWVWEKIPIEQKVGARWIGYTILLLFVAIGIAILLPTRYSLGLLDTLGYLLSFIVALVQTIFYTIMALILNLLSRLFPDLNQQPLPPLKDVWPRLPEEVPPPSSADFIQSLIFWSIFLFLAGYVIIQFLRQHPGLLGGLQHVPGLSFIARLWRRLIEWFGGLNRQIEEVLEARRRARRPAATRSVPAPRRWMNLRRLSPRQQVQFYYLAMLRRSGERGHARGPTQTPYEYARALESQIPEIDHDIDGITQEFIEARYSQHNIDPEQVSVVRRYWERIKRALNR